MTEIQKAWGTELIIANNDRYCGKVMRLNRGWQCSLHHHKIKDETFYVLEGVVRFELGGKRLILIQGESVYVAPGVKHRFGSRFGAIMIEISTPHSDDDVYRDEESRKMVEHV